jgi:O-antigen ligase
MSDDALLIARVLFWAFSAGLAFLPMRWAIFCLILASHIDITSLSFASATNVGFENTVRIAVLPLLLLARTQFRPLKELRWTLPHKLWLALTLYVAIAGFWGGFPLSAVKLVTYLAAYFVYYCIFCAAWQACWLDLGLMRLASWCVLALAVLQTYALGNGWGGIEERFTSFSSPQYFAAFLVALLAILVFSGGRGLVHYATCGVLVVAIFCSGSRYVFVSTVLLLIIASFRVSGTDAGSLRFRVTLRKVLLGLGLAAAGVALLLPYLPDNRMQQLAMAASDQDLRGEDIGTLAWRLSIYDEIWTRLEKRAPAQLFFGSGTCSGAALMLDLGPTLYDRETIDGNRALHSEYLRALYEWGILGFAVLLAFLIAMIVGFTRKIAAEGGGPAVAFLGVLPSILIGLGIENVLAGAASAAGVGILLALSFAWEAQPSYVIEVFPLNSVTADRPALSL